MLSLISKIAIRIYISYEIVCITEVPLHLQITVRPHVLLE